MADLIDRKATIEYFVTNLGWYDECDNPVYDFDEKRKYITEFISGVTPVDAVPVIHAHPIFEYGRENAKCSNCGNYTIEFNPYAFEYDKYDISNWDKYCSFCGAKMDEGDEKK